jgi:hypothetical protein
MHELASFVPSRVAVGLTTAETGRILVLICHLRANITSLYYVDSLAFRRFVRNQSIGLYNASILRGSRSSSPSISESVLCDEHSAGIAFIGHMLPSPLSCIFFMTYVRFYYACYY